MARRSERDVVYEIACDCIGARVRILSRAISGIYDDALRPYGVRFSQMNILVATAKIGVAHQADVCEVLQMDHSTVSRNVERMCARGWLEKLTSEDGRAAPFRLTDQGRRLIHKTHTAWKHSQDRITEMLGGDSIAFFKEAAIRVHKADMER